MKLQVLTKMSKALVDHIIVDSDEGKTRISLDNFPHPQCRADRIWGHAGL